MMIGLTLVDFQNFHFLTKLKITEAITPKFLSQKFEKEKCDLTIIRLSKPIVVDYPRVVNWLTKWNDFKFKNH